MNLPTPICTPRLLRNIVSVTGAVVLCAGGVLAVQASESHAVFTDETTRAALESDPVLKNLQGQKPVELISALMPGLYDEDRLLDASQRAAIDGIQRRLRDDADILTFLWIGPPSRLANAVADNVRLVRGRTDGQAAAVLLFTPSPARYAVLCSQPLVASFESPEAAASFFRQTPDAETFRTAPGETIVQHVAAMAERLMGRQSATRKVNTPLFAAAPRPEPAPALPAQPPMQEGIEPREILIVALAASVGGLLVGLLLFLIQARRHKSRARNMSSHFVVAAQSPAPVAEAGKSQPFPDNNALAAAMPAAGASIVERLQLAQVRLLSLRQSAESLQHTMHSATADLLSHIEREVQELEALREALEQRR